MAIVPKQSRVSGEFRQPAPSLAGMTAVSGAVSQLGDVGLDIGLKVQAVRERIDSVRRGDIVNQARLIFASASRAHDEFANDPAGGLSNPDLLSPDYEDRMAAARERLNSIAMPDDMRNEVGTQFDLMVEGGRHDTNVNAMKLRVRNARTNLDALTTLHEESGDFASSENLFDNAVTDGLLTPEEAAYEKSKLSVRRTKYEENAAYQAEVGKITANPRQWIKDTPNKPRGVDDTTYSTLRRHAEAEVNRQDADAIDRVEDAVINRASGMKPINPAEIDAEYPNLRPSVREKLKAWVVNRNDDIEKARIADPVFQKQLLARVNATMVTWDPQSSRDMDETYASLLTDIDAIADPGIKAEARERITRIKAQGRSETDDPMEYGLGVIKRAGDGGLFGKRWSAADMESSKVSVAKLVQDGFLQNWDKVKSLGFSDAQTTAITGIVRTKTKDGEISKYDIERIGGTINPDGTVEKSFEFDSKKSKYKADSSSMYDPLNRMRMEALQSLWEFRENKKANPGGMTLRTAEAIVNHESTVEVDRSDEEKASRIGDDAKSRRTEGENIQKFRSWYRDEINAGRKPTMQDVEKWMGDKLNATGASTKAAPSRRQKRDTPAIPPDTSMNTPESIWKDAVPVNQADRPKVFKLDVKLSNYGYSDDDYLDSNSAKGIGHGPRRLKDESSVAISKGLVDQLGIKDGAILELQTTKGNRIVRYDDTVPSEYKGRALPPTIDIYRKTNGSNDWSGRVTGLRVIKS